MSISQQLVFSWRGGSTLAPITVTKTGATEDNRSETVAGSTTNQLVPMALTLTKLLLCYITSDVTLTLKTNNSGSPQEVITITAGCPFIWYKDCGIADPFGGNITAFYFSNGTSDAATLEIRTLQEV